mgnify:CR=1 FL=1
MSESKPTYARELDVAKRATRAAGEAVMQFYNAQTAQTYVKKDGSAVTDADLAADRIIRQTILDAFPNDALLTEEGVDDDLRLGNPRVWIVDPIGGMSHGRPSVIRERIRSEFAPLNAPVHVGFDDWFGADVALATGWQTVFPVLQLDAPRARAYFVQDHEPEFYGGGTEHRWAQETYTKGLHAICASPWLADIVTERYGGTASVFQLGQDPTVYHPRPVPRRRDTIVFYGRAVTPRRAVPLGMLALAELYRRRPDTRIVIYGDPQPPAASFPFEHAGVASQEHLALLYSEATVGLCLSMTNYSRVPAAMRSRVSRCIDVMAQPVPALSLIHI